MLYIYELNEHNHEKLLLETGHVPQFSPKIGEELNLWLSGNEWGQVYIIKKVRHHLVVGKSYNLELHVRLVGI